LWITTLEFASAVNRIGCYDSERIASPGEDLFAGGRHFREFCKFNLAQ
jgi:hypothetical protein